MQVTRRTNLKSQSPVMQTWSLFVLDCETRALSPRTLDYYRDKLYPFIVWCDAEGLTNPDAITATHIKTYLALAQQRNLSPYTVHGIARCVKLYLNYLVRDGLIERSPFDRVKMPKLPDDLLPPFAMEEVTALLEVTKTAENPQRDRALLLFMLDSGVRAQELCDLLIGDVDMTTGCVRVRLGKGRKTRTTFVSARTKKELTRYLMGRVTVGAEEPLFVDVRSGDKLEYDGLRAILTRLGKKAGVADVTAHRCRRTFAIESLRAGCPIMQLSAMMGHGSLQVLQRYLQLVEDDLQAAHEAHNPLDGLMKRGGRNGNK